MNREFFYISNIISASRFLLTGVCAYFLIEEMYIAGSIMIIVIWLSDLLDGYAARSRNEISELGKLIDPLADKTAIIVISLIMVIKGFIPLWFVGVILLRDIMILSGGLYLKSKKHIILQSNRIGKFAVFTIGLTLLVFLVSRQNLFSYPNEFTELLLPVLVFLSLVMIVFSIVSYFKRFLTEINRN